MNVANTKILKLPFIAGAASVTVLGVIALIVLLFTGNKESISDTPTPDDHSVMESLVSPVDNFDAEEDSFEQKIQKITDLSTISSNFSRSIALSKLLNEADFQQTLNLLDESKQVSDVALRQSTQVEIFRRLASLDPERALSYSHNFLRAQRQLYQSVVYREWSYKDIDSVVKYTEQHLQSLESNETIMILHSILNAGHSLSDEAKRDIARRFDLELYFDASEERARRFTMLENPVEHWNLLLGDSLSDHDQIEDLVSIALAVIENDGFDEFRTMHQELSDRRIRNEVLREVLLDRLRTEGYESVFNHAVSLLDGTNRSIVFDIADRWFQRDATATFTALSNLEDEGLRDDLFETTALYLANSKPLQALELLESMPESIRGVIVYTALMGLSTRDPVETAKHLSKISQYQEQAAAVPAYAQGPQTELQMLPIISFASGLKLIL